MRSRIQVNGRAATVDDLLQPAVLNYGHFTAMQTRGGRVRGLGLHLRRLDEGTRELFGTGLDGDRVRDCVRRAAGDRDASVRVIVQWPEGATEPTVLVVVRPPVTLSPAPQRLRSVGYLRPVPHVKHLGGFGQLYHRRRVAREGYDEALLTGPDGVVAEGAITNIGFLDGDQIVWPDAPQLAGVTLQLLQERLPWRREVVRLADAPSFDGAFVANSQGVAPVAEIDGAALPVPAARLAEIAAAYEAVPWDAV
ncbi:aminotransferase class IV [Actinomadura hibisca]|uniref:aminotransferase class IV n=1 Tax=Actinomadura hibisca TaxID=68565 RepID=UPI00082ABDFA|nr:aminotransferase class IV [Actinomadura hibisca]